MNNAKGVSQEWLRYLVFLQAFVAMLGSLFFSEVLLLPPCELCWFQRICMYPIVLLSLVGILRKDNKLYSYILPLASIGWLISIYHNYLYLQPSSDVFCKIGVSCTSVHFALFGIFTIPVLSFLAYSVIIGLMIWSWRKDKKGN
jgi:disulfide bond formation protein DsbB